MEVEVVGEAKKNCSKSWDVGEVGEKQALAKRERDEAEATARTPVRWLLVNIHEIPIGSMW